MPSGPSGHLWFSLVFRRGKREVWLQVLPGCGTQVVVTGAPPGLSSRTEAWIDSQGQWAVGSPSWTHLPLDCSPSLYGFLFWVGGSGPLPLGKPHRTCLRNRSYSPKASTQTSLAAREACAQRGHRPGYFGHCLASARSLPSPGPAPKAWETAWAPISCLEK